MNQPTVMRTLIGKDVRIVFPLVLIGWVGCLVCNLLLFLLWQYWDVDHRGLSGGSITIWVMIPGLVAFGAASLLIGTEEDSGTLSWLRTLPVSWQHIAASKLVVGVGAFASVFTLASLFLWLLSHGWRGPAGSIASDRLSLQDVFVALFFQLLLLLLGFVVSYGIRMPVAGLITLFPLFGLVTIGIGILLDWFQLGERGVVSPVVALVFGSGFLSVIGLVQHVLARRRLTGADSSKWSLAPESSINASRYRPPSFGINSKPSQAASLLWQQCRQTAPACLSMIGISLLLLLLLLMTSLDQPAREDRLLHVMILFLASLFIVLSASWIGVLTFYADNRYRRYAFLTDRGISPTKVWWTRLVPTLIGITVLAIAVATLGRFIVHGTPGWSNGSQMIAMIIVMFAFGQLVSQGIERPVLAFAAAPAYASICLMPLFYFLDEAALIWMWLTVPILLFASWHLSRWWLEGQNKAGYAIGVIGYTILAVGLPCLLYAGSIILAWPVRLL